VTCEHFHTNKLFNTFSMSFKPLEIYASVTYLLL